MVVQFGIDEFTGEFLNLLDALNVDLGHQQSFLIEDFSPEVRNGEGIDLGGVSSAGESLGSVELALYFVSEGNM